MYKEHCWTLYEKVCKGYGYHKKCFPVPKQRCKQIPVKVGKKVRKEHGISKLGKNPKSNPKNPKIPITCQRN